MHLRWHDRAFSDLSAIDLYALLALRTLRTVREERREALRARTVVPSGG